MCMECGKISQMYRKYETEKKKTTNKHFILSMCSLVTINESTENKLEPSSTFSKCSQTESYRQFTMS